MYLEQNYSSKLPCLWVSNRDQNEFKYLGSVFRFCVYVDVNIYARRKNKKRDKIWCSEVSENELHIFTKFCFNLEWRCLWELLFILQVLKFEKLMVPFSLDFQFPLKPFLWVGVETKLTIVDYLIYKWQFEQTLCHFKRGLCLHCLHVDTNLDVRKCIPYL